MNTKKINKIEKGFVIFLIIFLSIVLISPGLVSAGENDTVHGNDLKYVPLSPLPNIEGGGDMGIVNSLGSYLKNIYNIIIGLSAVLAVIMITIGGIEYMTSEVVGKKESAKQRITGALLGLVLVFSSWLFLNTINPDLVNFSLNIQKIRLEYKGVTTPGWYCKTDEDNNVYNGPYNTNSDCVADNSECSSCENIVQDTPNSGNYEATNNNGFNMLTGFYDTSIASSNNGAEDSGWYFDLNLKPKGPFAKLNLCLVSKDRQEEKGEFVGNECYSFLGPNDLELANILIDETNVRQKIKSEIGIIMSETNICKEIGEKNCINVGLISENVLTGLSALKNKCKKNIPGCEIMITGGTEWWLHGNKEKEFAKNDSTHKSPGKVIDLYTGTLYTKLDQFIVTYANNIIGTDPGMTPLGDPFLPKDMTQFLFDDSSELGLKAMFRFEQNPNRWHVEFN